MRKGFFVPNRDFAHELLTDDEIRKEFAKVAAIAVPYITQFADEAEEPWMRRAGHALIEVEPGDDSVFIVNTDFGAHLAEWGSKNNPPHAPMRRGVRAAGFTLDEE